MLRVRWMQQFVECGGGSGRIFFFFWGGGGKSRHGKRGGVGMGLKRIAGKARERGGEG